MGGSGPGPSGDRGSQPPTARRRQPNRPTFATQRALIDGNLEAALAAVSRSGSDSLPSPYAARCTSAALRRVSTTRGRRSRRCRRFASKTCPAGHRRPARHGFLSRACGPAPRTRRVRRTAARWPGSGSSTTRTWRPFFSQEAGALIAMGRSRRRRRGHRPLRRRPRLRSGGIGAALYHAARELAAHGHAARGHVRSPRAPPPGTRTASTAPSRRLACALRYANALLRSRRLPAGARHPPRSDAGSARQPRPTRATTPRALASVRRLPATKRGGSPTRWRRPTGRSCAAPHLYQRARVLAALGDGEAAVRALQAAFVAGARHGPAPRCTSTRRGTQSAPTRRSRSS